MVYGEKFGSRGKFAAWDRERKKKLYINGLKFLNYHAEKPNFRGRFVKQKAINESLYLEKKLKHLKEQEFREKQKKTRLLVQRNKLIVYMVKELNVSVDKAAELVGIEPRSIYNVLRGMETT